MKEMFLLKFFWLQKTESYLTCQSLKSGGGGLFLLYKDTRVVLGT